MMSMLSLAGRSLLDRRAFLANLGSGTGALALIHLLADERKPLRPAVRGDMPLAPRAPHFEAKAKRVLHIFCSGACSHLDTFDYKPELLKRHGQPLPGGDKLVTFQGEQGNVTQS